MFSKVNRSKISEILTNYKANIKYLSDPNLTLFYPVISQSCSTKINSTLCLTEGTISFPDAQAKERGIETKERSFLADSSRWPIG